MRLDHIAYRVADRKEAVEFFSVFLGYQVDPELPYGFDIQFEDGSMAKCYVLLPPEKKEGTPRLYEAEETVFHQAPEIFVSDGSDNSIVAEWVAANGSGIHHLAYEVESVEKTMIEWSLLGIQFTTEKPLKCDGLKQAFTKPHPVTGIIYEIIERDKQGFCRDNVKDLMESTKDI
jgi:catechol 2,3-dioxygenase-like lactoylglutathione lyase family enzyme